MHVHVYGGYTYKVLFGSKARVQCPRDEVFSEWPSQMNQILTVDQVALAFRAQLGVASICLELLQLLLGSYKLIVWLVILGMAVIWMLVWMLLVLWKRWGQHLAQLTVRLAWLGVFLETIGQDEWRKNSGRNIVFSIPELLKLGKVLVEKVHFRQAHYVGDLGAH